MPTEHFQRGQVIFREGDKSQEAYFIVNGLVEITLGTSHGVQSLAKIGPGEIFGEMGMIMDRPRSATATAIDNTAVEVISDEEFEREILQRPDRLHVYLATLFERIRKTDLLLTTTTNATVPLNIQPKQPVVKEPVFRVKLASQYGASLVDLPPVSKTITKLPFRIGRSYFDTAVSSLARNDLSIEDSQPHHLSRNHCEVDFADGSFVLRDRGSKLGTWVNGAHVSVDSGVISCPLKVGENKIIFGGEDSPHHFTITIEELK